jgi:hypothetical protein
MLMRTDGELLSAVLANNAFMESVLKHDRSDNWTLAKELGEFLVRIEPDSEILGHALQARACRHLGEIERARIELTACRARIADRGIKEWESSLLQALLSQEEKYLG